MKVDKITAGMKQKIDVFMGALGDPFNIAAAKALTMMRHQKDKKFLEK